MTNKLPVVGKRYRLKNYKAEVINVDSEGVTYLQGDKEYWDFLDDFRDYFEELPEDKAETKPETQSHISESKEKMKQALDIIRNRKKYLEGYNNGFDDCLKEMAERFPDQISETSLIPSNSRELSPEVKEAMEKLKDDIKAWVDDVFGDFTPLSRIKPLEPGPVYETLMMINDLLNALDKQFMSKEEVKIDIKQEYVDSVKVNETSKSVAVKEEEVKEKEESIWKPVSKLPEDSYTVIIKAKGGYGEIFFGAYREDTQHFMDEAMKFVYPKKSIDKYCTLTDFINDYEKLKERDKLKEIKLRELEERVKKLEEK